MKIMNFVEDFPLDIILHEKFNQKVSTEARVSIKYNFCKSWKSCFFAGSLYSAESK